MQELNKTYAEASDVEVVLVHASANFGRHSTAKSLLDEKNITVPVIENGAPIGQKYGVRGYPTLIVIDTSGKVVYTKNGALTPNGRRDLEKRIEKLRAEGRSKTG